MDNTLPIDPRLADIGAGLPFQTLVFGQVFEARAEAFVVATLVQDGFEASQPTIGSSHGEPSRSAKSAGMKSRVGFRLGL